MKKLLAVIFVLVIALFGFSACANDAPCENTNGGTLGGIVSDGGSGDKTDDDGKTDDDDKKGDDGDKKGDDGEETPPPPASTSSDILIAYFSCTDTTKGIATHVAAKTKGTLYEIVPEIPYTPDDLRYYTDCRADKEQADSTARPAISGSVENIEKYDVIYIGYPIWHGQAPKIIYTFLESYDFSGKTIVPFCTSASSGIGTSDRNLHPLAPSAKWLPGKRFAAGTSQSAVATWIDGLDIKTEEITNMYLTVNGNKLEVTLAQNSAVDALVEILKNGDITYTADDYGGFEKVGSLGHTLPASNSQITTEAGDVILYSGNQIVLFYGSNSWSYTRLGKINGYSASELSALLGAGQGSVHVTISLK